METQDKIRRIIEFMNIPDFEQIMSAKLLELEMVLRPQIKRFKEQKEKFKKNAAEEMALVDTDTPNQRPRTYYFELKRVKDHRPWFGEKWTLWFISPDPTDPAPETALNQLAETMGGIKPNPVKIEHREIFVEPARKFFDIGFTRYSDTFAFGNLRQSSREVQPHPQGEKSGMVKLNLDFKSLKKEDSYGELMRCLETYPETRERILAYFFMMEKPRIHAHAAHAARGPSS